MMLINRSIRLQQQQQQPQPQQQQQLLLLLQPQQQQPQQQQCHDHQNAKRPKQKRNNSFTSSAFFQALQPKSNQIEETVFNDNTNDTNDNESKPPRRNTLPSLIDPHHRKNSITKFNLGGLFKKKINQKRPSIDSITNNVTQINLNNQNYDTYEPSYTTAPYNNPNHRGSLGACSTSSFNSNTSSTTTGVTTADSSLPVSFPNHHHHTKHETPRTEERYTSFTAECISLQNSEMTSHLDLEDDEPPEEDDKYILQLQSSFQESFDHNLEESIQDYQPGGYHPVHIGDHYKSSQTEYKIIRKLGWGHFSTVWLAQNLFNNQFVAIKIVKLSHNYYEAAEDEIKILKLLNEDDDGNNDDLYYDGKHRIMSLLDDFIIKGINGNHIAMVFEILGENILHLIYKFKREKIESLQISSNPSIIPINSIKSIVKQILTSINYMHHRGIIHTDLKPENILVKYQGNVELNSKHSNNFLLPLYPLLSNLNDCSLIKIADLGNATFANLHFTNQIQTRQYRSPEIIMKYKSWGSSTDLWSIGCIIFELITGDYLFDPHDGCNFDKDEDHLAQIFELLGNLPLDDYLNDCKLTPRFFIRDDSNHFKLKNIRHLKMWKLLDVFVDKYKFDPNDVNVLLVTDLILKCLRFDLDDRYDCHLLLSHPWFDENPSYDPITLQNLPNIHDDLPGYTSTWDIDD